MPSTAHDFAIMRFSTDALPERDRAPMLCDFYGPVIARLEIEPMPDQPLHFEGAAWALPDLAVSTLACSALRARRSRELIADGNDSCVFSAIRSPGNTIVQRGHEITPEGTGTLLSLADPFSCTAVGGIAGGISVTVPRKVLAASVPRLEDCFGQTFPRSDALTLLTGYVGLLEHDHLLASHDLRRLAVAHVHDLVALALGASRDAAEIAKGRGLRAARLHAIKADIRTSLGEQGLSLTAIAARQGVTPRYVQALFADEGSTFSQFLVAERLARVHQMLCDPLHVARTTSAIAYDAGFGDLSHFNRAFRRRYGGTPSDVRAAAKRQGT
jgi:AraC-like DNA-binding protein